MGKASREVENSIMLDLALVAEMVPIEANNRNALPYAVEKCCRGVSYRHGGARQYGSKIRSLAIVHVSITERFAKQLPKFRLLLGHQLERIYPDDQLDGLRCGKCEQGAKNVAQIRLGPEFLDRIRTR